MDKGSIGMMIGKEVYTLVDTRMARGLKGRSISCNRMALTHFLMSSMMMNRMNTGMRSRYKRRK
jgi:hypothetical protein